jgi:ABC-type polysaccharide/polyol phosphate export permease
MGNWLLILSSLAAKELKVRYKRSLLGFAWFLLKPLFQTAVFAVVFTQIIRFGGSLRHYALFLLSGLLVWNFFSSSLTAASTSLLDNVRLVRSIRFPRAALPVSSVAANAAHLLLSLLVLEALLLAWGHAPSPAFLLLVPALAMLLAMTAGLSLMLSVWNVYYRDVSLLLEVLLLAWFYASPVIYPLGTGMLPPAIEGILRYNPVSGFLETIHGLLYFGCAPPAWCWISMVSWSAILLACGLAVFRRSEPAVVKEL